MTMESNYRRYRISKWSQLSECRSNSSKELRISVTEYLNNPCINGTHIEVIHPRYGTLFAYTIRPSGHLTLPLPKGTDQVMTSHILLNELKRYGFYVEYKEEMDLPSGQLSLIRSAKDLGGRKLRLMRVYDDSDPETADIYVVAFDPSKIPDWMNSGYSCSKRELMEALYNGHAFNLSTMPATSRYRWDWLYNTVYDVYVLLDECSSDAPANAEEVPSPTGPIEGSEEPGGEPDGEAGQDPDEGDDEGQEPVPDPAPDNPDDFDEGIDDCDEGIDDCDEGPEPSETEHDMDGEDGTPEGIE